MVDVKEGSTDNMDVGTDRNKLVVSTNNLVSDGGTLACTLTLALGAVLMNLSGFAWIEIGGAKLTAAVVVAHQMENLDEPPTLPRPV